MICLFNSYNAPPNNTNINIYNGPARPTTAENAIVIVKAILNAPVAVLPYVRIALPAA